MSSSAIFATNRLHLAVAIHATNSLTFLGCKQVSAGSNKGLFLFDDPEGRASELELAFSVGRMVAPCNLLFASYSFLRQQLSAAIEGGRNGNR